MISSSSDEDFSSGPSTRFRRTKKTLSRKRRRTNSGLWTVVENEDAPVKMADLVKINRASALNRLKQKTQDKNQDLLDKADEVDLFNCFDGNEEQSTNISCTSSGARPKVRRLNMGVVRFPLKDVGNGRSHTRKSTETHSKVEQTESFNTVVFQPTFTGNEGDTEMTGTRFSKKDFHDTKAAKDKTCSDTELNMGFLSDDDNAASVASGTSINFGLPYSGINSSDSEDSTSDEEERQSLSALKKCIERNKRAKQQKKDAEMKKAQNGQNLQEKEAKKKGPNLRTSADKKKSSSIATNGACSKTTTLFRHTTAINQNREHSAATATVTRPAVTQSPLSTNEQVSLTFSDDNNFSDSISPLSRHMRTISITPPLLFNTTPSSPSDSIVILSSSTEEFGIRGRHFSFSNPRPPAAVAAARAEFLSPDAAQVVRQHQADEEMARRLQMELDSEYATILTNEMQSTDRDPPFPSSFMATRLTRSTAAPDGLEPTVITGQPLGLRPRQRRQRQPQPSAGILDRDFDLGYGYNIHSMPDEEIERYITDAANFHNVRVGGRPHLQRNSIRTHNVLPLNTAFDGMGNDYETLLQLSERIGDAQNKGLNDNQINYLPTKVFKKQVNSKQETDCNICMCEFDDGHRLRILPCFHCYHCECIDPWLKTNASCPICRVEVRLQ